MSIIFYIDVDPCLKPRSTTKSYFVSVFQQDIPWPGHDCKWTQGRGYPRQQGNYIYCKVMLLTYLCFFEYLLFTNSCNNISASSFVRPLGHVEPWFLKSLFVSALHLVFTCYSAPSYMMVGIR